MRLLVDGVFFQLNSTGIARVWETILGIIAPGDDLEVFMLDRGGDCGGIPPINGVTMIPFPSYKPVSSAADSILIQEVCDHLKVDAFTSSYYTTPLTTPTALIVHDMIPEIFDFDMQARFWMEKETAIACALRYLCVSHSTKADLLKFYPEITPDHIQVAHGGVDTNAFAERPAAEIADFRARHGLKRPYYLFVGSRVQHKAYKNSDLFFAALREMQNVNFDVFCVGGEEHIEPSVLDQLPQGVQAQRVSLSDYDLSLAYAGANALVYPSLYEGFGLPVIEAMASGCPVITTHCGSLGEASGDAAWTISGTSVSEMTEALTRLQDKDVRADLRARGLAHAQGFRWEPMAHLLHHLLQQVVEQASGPETKGFLADWQRLRSLQADVDYH